MVIDIDIADLLKMVVKLMLVLQKTKAYYWY